MKSVQFQNFIGFGTHLNIDLKVNIGGGYEYLFERIEFNPHGSEFDHDERVQVIDMLEAAFTRLFVQLNNRGYYYLSDYLRNLIEQIGFADGADESFMAWLCFVFNLNSIKFETEDPKN